jgi:hypothetical protein
MLLTRSSTAIFLILFRRQRWPLAIEKENIGLAQLSTTDRYFSSSGIKMRGQMGYRSKIPIKSTWKKYSLRQARSNSGSARPFLCYCCEMKKTAAKPNLLFELAKRKLEAQKTGAISDSFGKFQPSKPRNENSSNVGPSWGRRKGN